MVYKTFLAFSLGFIVATRGAPTALDPATLLQNAEEAQALNRQFQGLNVSDPCTDGQVACIGTKTIAKCQGTNWETALDQCSKSQQCFALPSVSSSGIQITCTSERSAENLINACGATGGIFGNPTNSTTSGDAGSGNTTVPSPTNAETNAPTYASGTVTVMSSPTLDGPPSAPGNNVDGDTDQGTSSTPPCSMHRTGVKPPYPTPTAFPDTSSSQTAPPVLATGAPSIPAATGATPERVTVTVTLIPSKPVTLPPTTRTISPEEASSVIASIQTAGGYTAAPNAPNSSAPVVIPASSPEPDISSTVPTPNSPSAAQGGYGGR